MVLFTVKGRAQVPALFISSETLGTSLNLSSLPICRMKVFDNNYFLGLF